MASSIARHPAPVAGADGSAALQHRSGEGQPRFERAHPVWIEYQRVSHPPPPFTGELFVLVGPATFSSANWFAAVVRDNNLGKLVGEPTRNARPPDLHRLGELIWCATYWRCHLHIPRRQAGPAIGSEAPGSRWLQVARSERAGGSTSEPARDMLRGTIAGVLGAASSAD